ncbi:MAG TPA: aldo/keto reductase, partial [Gaiellaceae bacterium]|nr:aldo/keto reductase [Gaiellaceae bacterium]
MRYRQLGDSGIEVSEVCLGSWLTYGGAVESAQAEACVDAAFDAGINFIDTANVYSRGKAEEFLGEVLSKRPRDSYILATKLLGEMPNGKGLSREQVHLQIDDSLARLRTDYVDLYQAHAFDEEVPLEESLQAFDEVVQAGKARFIGVSNWSGEQIQQAVDVDIVNIVSSQPEYSMLHRDPEQDVIPVSRANGISQIVYSPLAQGVLSGKYKPGSAAPKGTRAAARPDDMWGYTDDAVLERVQQLRPVADGLGITMAQLALAWALREPNLASVIVGASRPEQVADNASASGIELDAETLSR